MIGHQASGDGALDLLAVQRDDELLDLLGARVAVQTDDVLVRLLVAWRDEVDDGLPGVVPVPRAASEPARAATRPAQPRDGLHPAAGPGRAHRRRLTATGTAAALVLGGTLSLSGVAAAVTGDPLAPYRAVGHALSIGGDSLPEHAADVAKLNKRLSRARAAVAHGDVAGAQAVVDELTAQLASADLTDKQRAAVERRLAALRAALARAAAAEAERGRSENRATAVATPPPHLDDGRGADGDAVKGGGNEQAGADEKGGPVSSDDPATADRSDGSAKASTPENKPTSKPTKPAPERPDPTGGADAADPADPADQAPTDPGDEGVDGDQSAGRPDGTGSGADGGPTGRGRSAGAGSSAAVEQLAPAQPAPDQEPAGPPAAASDAARAAGGSPARR